MGRWIRRRYKSSHATAPPRASFRMGRWIRIPISTWIVHIQVICYEVSAPQISTPLHQRDTPPLQSFAERDSSRHLGLKCSWMKWQVAVTSLSQLTPRLRAPPHLLPALYWSNKKHLQEDFGWYSEDFVNISRLVTALDERLRWACAGKMHLGAHSKCQWGSMMSTINNNQPLLISHFLAKAQWRAPTR